jgi:hypothetical protein
MIDMENKRFCWLLLLLAIVRIADAQPIDRKALVQRHNVHNTYYDSLSSVTVGNGAFAFTVDITGLQSFPNAYANGVPLGTQSEWGWHSFPNPNQYRVEEALRTYQLDGRPVTYAVQPSAAAGPSRTKEASDYFRQNVHRLQLGNLGFDILLKNGAAATIHDIKNIEQVLDLWTGEVRSSFTVEGTRVTVSTVGHPQKDAVAVHVSSVLVKEGRIRVSLKFPFPTAAFSDAGVSEASPEQHRSLIQQQAAGTAVLQHTLDTTTYYVAFQWKNKGVVQEKAPHYFQLVPAKEADDFTFTCVFSAKPVTGTLPAYTATLAQSAASWKDYWTKGAAVDFSGSTDARAKELERRVVLSQYLLRVQEAGEQPPQETGLTYNSWFGKPHLEMHWWHAAQYGLWNRTSLLEKSMQWYSQPAVYKNAKAIAVRQGYEGVRWQKMTDPDGNESPSSIGAFLIWQQPHFIYFAELCYRDQPNAATLAKYKDRVFATADFMVSYARYDSVTHKYVLGHGLIPAQETFKAEETLNPSFELTYWHWALTVAQQWRTRLNLPRNKKYDAVLQQLAPLPQHDGLYYPTESALDSYTNPKYKTDHPIVLGNMGMLAPVPGIDTAVMHRTFNWVWNNWSWPDTWGWDFPLTAMAATRLGLPEKAIDALLMNITTNTYLPNGHNYQDGRLRIYLPGNGGLLAAVAMMVAGYDGSTVNQPGIPKNAAWKVRAEGLKKMP